DGGDGRWIVQREQTLFELVGQFRAMFRLAARKRVACDVERMAQMIGGRQTGSELATVAGDAADRDAAEADAVIAAFAADQTDAPGVAARAGIAECDLERGIDGRRAVVAEEHAVEPGRRHVRKRGGGLER